MNHERLAQLTQAQRNAMATDQEARATHETIVSIFLALEQGDITVGRAVYLLGYQAVGRRARPCRPLSPGCSGYPTNASLRNIDIEACQAPTLAQSLLIEPWRGKTRRLQMREQDTFTILLRWSEQEGAYLGEVPDLVGIQGTGSTYEEALTSVLEAIRWRHEMSGEGSSSPVSQMLMEDTAEAEAGEEPSPGC